MRHGLLLALVTLALPGGCPTDPGGTGELDGLIETDFDGAWRITSETGLANCCITILGDRVTQYSECDGAINLVSQAELSARSGNQIIWTFQTPDADADTLHTISVFVQPDGTLRGTYSIRLPDSVFAVTDDIIMARRQIRA